MQLNKKWTVGILSLSIFLMNFIPIHLSSDSYGKANKVKFYSRTEKGNSIQGYSVIAAVYVSYVLLGVSFVAGGNKENRLAINFNKRHDRIDSSIKIDLSKLD